MKIFGNIHRSQEKQHQKLNIHGCGNSTALFIATGEIFVLLKQDILPQTKLSCFLMLDHCHRRKKCAVLQFCKGKSHEKTGPNAGFSPLSDQSCRAKARQLLRNGLYKIYQAFCAFGLTPLQLHRLLQEPLRFQPLTVRDLH